MTERRKVASPKTSARRANSRKTPNARKMAKAKPAKKVARKASSHRAPGRRQGSSKSAKRWSQHVTDTSDALDLKHGVFKLHDPKKIAISLKRSAEHSARRKAGAYRSALSMLTFYINRAGRNLPRTQLRRLERAKDELKKQFGRM